MRAHARTHTQARTLARARTHSQARTRARTHAHVPQVQRAAVDMRAGVRHRIHGTRKEGRPAHAGEAPHVLLQASSSTHAQGCAARALMLALRGSFHAHACSRSLEPQRPQRAFKRSTPAAATCCWLTRGRRRCIEKSTCPRRAAAWASRSTGAGARLTAPTQRVRGRGSRVNCAQRVPCAPVGWFLAHAPRVSPSRLRLV